MRTEDLHQGAHRRAFVVAANFRALFDETRTEAALGLHVGKELVIARFEDTQSNGLVRKEHHP
jgi:hypothetical protein